MKSLVLWPWQAVKGCGGCFAAYFVALYLMGLVLSPALCCTLTVLLGAPSLADAYPHLPEETPCIVSLLALVILAGLSILGWVLFVIILERSKAHFTRERNGCGWEVEDIEVVGYGPSPDAMSLVPDYGSVTHYYCGKHAPGLSNLWRRSRHVTP